MTQATSKNVKVDSIYLLNFESNFVDITSLGVEFSIYENLFDHCITGYLILSDNNGFLEKFPIIGEELITIAFSTPGEKRLKYNFSVYKVDTVRDVSNNSQPNLIYTLHLVAPQKIISNISSVDNSFNGIKCSEIINSVHENYIKKSTKRYTQEEKIYLDPVSLDVEETENTISIVSPMWKPFDLIQYCVKHSKSDKYSESDFVYYQDHDGFHFRSISSLLEKDSVEKYYVAEASNSSKFGDNVVIKDYQIVSSVERKLNFDVLKREYEGMYDNTLYTIDPILKKFQETVFNYNDPKVSFTSPLNLDKLSTQYSIHSKANGSCHTRYIVSNISQKEYKDESYLKDRVFVDDKVKDNQAMYPSLRYRFLNKRVSKMSQLKQGLKIHIQVPGNTNLLVGDNINFYMPQTSSSYDDKENNILFGRDETSKFIITSLNHFFKVTDNMYYTNLEIVKNGFGSKIKNRS